MTDETFPCTKMKHKQAHIHTVHTVQIYAHNTQAKGLVQCK